MVRGKFSMKNIRISLDAYKIEYIRRFGIRKITAQGEVVYPRTISPEPQKYDFWVKVILHIIIFP